MTGSTLAQVLIPIVVAIALFGWLFAVLYADTHPKIKHHSKLPRYEVTGGAFQARDGGRQLMPLPGEPPLVPAPRTETSGQRAQPVTAEQQEEEEQHLVAGSKLR